MALVGAATFLDGFATVIEGDAMIAHCRNAHGADSYRALLERSDSEAWLAEVMPGGAPVGYCVLTAPDLPDAGTGDVEVKRIYSLSRFHGSGIGMALMDRAIRAARDRGATRLMLGVYVGNARAIAFYRKHGFEPVGTRRFTVGNQICDDHVMAMPL
nr:GNAT family N-acetyltransferase [Stakelama flava]